MDYTYKSYRNLMRELKENGYETTRFCDVDLAKTNTAIIRHDVDMDLQKALEMAEVEHEIGVKSTYFVLLTSDYYNLFSRDNIESSKRILHLGHEIGLHFDITAYGDDLPLTEIGRVLKKEIHVLGECLEINVKSLSWHIPRSDLLGVHLDITDELGVWNAYDPVFFDGYKYVSDSMMRWREPVEEYICEKKYDKLQILTHPIWYREVQDSSAEKILDQSRDDKIKRINMYLDTIKPGYYNQNSSN